ncbi:MAG TPA: Ig-like domain repeat protein, partial [Clostridiales bacterium]|nr:Ig-like domain repeat protein [Clostridiales bacterium]
MKKRFLKSSILLIVLMLIFTLILSVNKTTIVSAYGYNINVLNNPTPSSSSGWALTNAKWNDGSYGGEFKGLSNDPMYASQTFTFSDRDVYRMNNGEIKIDASGYFWAQITCSMWAYLKTTFYSASNTYLGEKIVEYGKYKTGNHNEKLSFTDYTVPKGTKYIIYQAKNDDSLSGYHPSMRNFVLTVKDTTAPTYIATIPVTQPAKYKMGTKIRYKVQFTEPVNVISQGYIKFKISTQEFNTSSNTNCTYAGQSDDGTTLYYDLTLPGTTTPGDNLSVTITGLSGITVKDDAGNSCTTIPVTLNLSNGFYVDNKPPEVSSFTTTASTNALYKAGETLQFDVTFHEYIWVNGTPKINLSNGKSANYIKKTQTDTKIASFFYTIAKGEDKKNLAITSIDFTGIYDSVSNYATESAGYSSSAYNSFLNNKYISIDTIAPATTFSAVPGTPGSWQKAFDVTLSPTDNIAGVKEIYAAWTSVNGTPSYPSAANVDTSTNKVILPKNSGTYELYVKLVDNVNNEDAQKSPYKYYFDFDAPVISASATKINGTDLVSSVTASVTDSHSGLEASTYVWKNESNAAALTGNAGDGISIPQVDGVYTLTITAADKVGNISTKTIENLIVDSVAPQVAFVRTEGAAFQKSYTVDFAITDVKSGVAGYYYIWSTSATKPVIDDKAWVVTTETSLTTPSGVSGTYYLHIKAVDNAGNIGIASTDGFNIDNKAPGVSITPNGNSGNEGKAGYDVVINVSDEITLYDQLTIKYVLSDSEVLPAPSELMDLKGNSITIENLDKTKYLYIAATDEAGNETVFKSNAFIADTAAPTGEISKATDIYYTNNNNVTININATDDYSSSIFMQIKIDNAEGEWEDLAEQKTVSFNKVEGEHIIYARFKDVCGNVSEYKNVKYYYDVTPPQIELAYSATKLTNSSVTVTATAKDNVSDVSFETVSQKTFNENGSFEFIAVDRAGNRARAAAKVDYIDKINPQISFASNEFDGKKHKSADITINASDANGISSLKYAVVRDGETAAGYISCTNGQTIQITELNGTYTVSAIAYDGAGNSTTVSSQKIYLDNIAPVAGIIYSPSARTAQNVVASITFDEEVTITNNGGLNTYTFPDNGSFTFEFTDEAGNTGTAAATVAWIDRNPPRVSVTLKNENGEALNAEKWTNKDVIVEINIPADCFIEVLKFNNISHEYSDYVTDLGNNQYKVSGYGRLFYQVCDSITGTIASNEVVIRIDKNPPTITNVTYSTTDWTNMNVTATVSATDDYNDVVYVNGSSHVFTENSEFGFIIDDSLGNRTTKTVKVSNIDKDVPVAKVSYDNTALTNQNVTATVSFDEGGSPVSITNNNGLNTYKFTANGEYTFEFSDKAGNAGSIKAAVNNIDKTPPEISLISDDFDLKPHKSASVKILGTDINGINSIKYRFVKEGESASYKSCENGDTVTLDNADGTYGDGIYSDGTYTLEVTAYDNAGNEKRVASPSLILDNTAPMANISYAPSARTAQNVVASINFNEDAVITNNNGLSEYTFTDNGDFTFEFSDIAGNTGTKTASVTWIDRNQPVATVDLSNENWTNEDVTVTLTPQDGAAIQNVKFNDEEIAETAENQYAICEYGILTYEVLDLTTETVGKGEVLVKIDRTEPTVTNITYSTKNWTNKDVSVNITAADNLSQVIYENGSSYTFTENGSYDFIIKDSAGNKAVKTVTVDWIDRDVPVAQVNYNITHLTNQNVIATISFDDGGSPVAITNNNCSRIYEFTANGEFIFEFSDEAGNKGTAAASVSNIDKVLPEISFSSSYFDMSMYTSVSVTINATDLNGIADLKYKFIKAGEDGGEFAAIQNGDTVALDSVSGVYQVIAIAKDTAGNEKTAYSQSLYLDNSAPV